MFVKIRGNKRLFVLINVYSEVEKILDSQVSENKEQFQKSLVTCRSLHLRWWL